MPRTSKTIIIAKHKMHSYVRHEKNVNSFKLESLLVDTQRLTVDSIEMINLNNPFFVKHTRQEATLIKVSLFFFCA